MNYTADTLHAAADRDRARVQKYMTTNEVSDLLRIPAETLRYWRHVGRGPKSFRFPGARRVLYASEDIDAYIAEARAEAEAS
jgi:hypothetical protein